MTENEIKAFVTELTLIVNTLDDLNSDLRDNLTHLAEMLANFVRAFNK